MTLLKQGLNRFWSIYSMTVPVSLTNRLVGKFVFNWLLFWSVYSDSIGVLAVRIQWEDTPMHLECVDRGNSNLFLSIIPRWWIYGRLWWLISPMLVLFPLQENKSEDIAMNFFTFQTGQSKNVPDDDLSTFQSQPEQSEDLPTFALATFHCEPRPSEDLPTANCVWNYSYL